MITPAQLAEAFARNARIVEMQAAGLTHADSLLQPPARGNCLNWIIGHTLRSRDDILQALGCEPVFADGARYARESDPITADGPGVEPLEALLARLRASQEALSAVLCSQTEETLALEAFLAGRNRKIGDWIFFLYFHECYHTGQAEFLRQLAGKDDKII